MKRCGFVAIVGRPNVGKSSLLNAILGKKVSITSFRPQTTRFQILGIKTIDNVQTVYVDTPGIHLKANKALNRQMNKTAHQSLIDVNAVIFVVESLKWTHEDEYVCQLLQSVSCPIILAINKVDTVLQKESLIPFMQKLNEKISAKIIPISVKKRIQLALIEEAVQTCLPESPFYFPEDQSINHSNQFHSSEIIREKIMRYLEKEVPYSTCVQIEKYDDTENLIFIHALIWVEREGQKRIIIGEKGAMLREIGTSARGDLEKIFSKKVCLKLWVKVNESWSESLSTLQNLGLVNP